MRQAALNLGTNLKKQLGADASVLGTVVAIAMNFLVFIMQWGSGMAVGSLQWDSALAGAIAGSLGAILMFVIFNMFGPIGTLIQACIALVDMLVGLHLHAHRSCGEAARWSPSGSAAASPALSPTSSRCCIYSGNVIVDMAAKNRLQFNGWQYTLDPSGKGHGGRQRDQDQREHHQHDHDYAQSRPTAPGRTTYWQTMDNDDNVKKSTFKYVWKDYDWATVDARVRRHVQPVAADGGRSHLHLASRRTARRASRSRTPGIRSLKAYLTRGLRGARTGMLGHLGPVGGCWIHENTGTNAYDIGSNLVFAVLPNTLDGFRTLAAKGAGYAQKLGQHRLPGAL